MRRSVVLACFSLACAGRQPAASSPNPAANLDRPPQALGKWRFIDSTVYEVNNGVSYRYTRSDGIRVDVYEYPIIPQGHPCRESCARSAVAAGVEEFQASIPAIVAQSGLDSIVSGERRSLKADESSWLEAGARFQFRIYGDTNRFESSLFLFSGRDTFLKVRATYRQGEDRSASVDSLITQVLRAWPPPYDCAAGEAAGDGIVMSATLARPASAIAERVKVAADSLHYSFAFADAAQGRWRTHPLFRWPPGTERESGDGTQHPGSILYVTTEPIGDSTKVEVASHLACRVSPADNAQTTLPLMNAMTFISVLSGRAPR